MEVRAKEPEDKTQPKKTKPHVLITIKFQIIEATQDEEAVSRYACLTVVEMAHSEQKGLKIGGTNFNPKGFALANKSMNALINVVSILSNRAGNLGYIPYRESVLTRLLKDSLGGHTSTTIVGCFSPAESCFEDTLATLKLCLKMTKISNKIVIQERQVAPKSSNISTAGSENPSQKLIGGQETVKASLSLELDDQSLERLPSPDQTFIKQNPEEIMKVFETKIKTLSVQELEYLKKFLAENQKFKLLQKKVQGPEFRGDFDEIHRLEQLGQLVSRLNEVLIEFGKVRLFIQDEIDHLDLHHFQKTLLRNMLAKVELDIKHLWIEQDQEAIDTEAAQTKQRFLFLQDQSDKRDTIILYHKKLMKEKSVQSKIMYDVLVRTDKVTSELKDVDVGNEVFQQLFDLGDSSTERHYQMGSLNTSHVSLDRSRLRGSGVLHRESLTGPTSVLTQKMLLKPISLTQLSSSTYADRRSPKREDLPTEETNDQGYTPMTSDRNVEIPAPKVRGSESWRDESMANNLLHSRRQQSYALDTGDQLRSHQSQLNSNTSQNRPMPESSAWQENKKGNLQNRASQRFNMDYRSSPYSGGILVNSSLKTLDRRSTNQTRVEANQSVDLQSIKQKSVDQQPKQVRFV